MIIFFVDWIFHKWITDKNQGDVYKNNRLTIK